MEQRNNHQGEEVAAAAPQQDAFMVPAMSSEEQARISQEMEALMSSQAAKLSLPALCQRLRLPEAQVLRCYLVGSRLWGTASHHSDWDFVVVLKDKSGGGGGGGEKAQLHNGNIDASVLTNSQFLKKIYEDHSMHYLICLWLPPMYRWKEEGKREPKQQAANNKNKNTKKPSTARRQQAETYGGETEGERKLSMQRLYESVAEETRRDWRIAEKRWQKGALAESKKTVVHALRLVLLATQIVERGYIHNYHVAFPLTHRLLYEEDGYQQEEGENEEDGWKRFHAKSWPIFEACLQLLEKACSA
ncbi:hypothetical protein QOT17_003182 [Balamuthia mandrillaris]